jgi:hypothetical protein
MNLTSQYSSMAALFATALMLFAGLGRRRLELRPRSRGLGPLRQRLLAAAASRLMRKEAHDEHS